MRDFEAGKNKVLMALEGFKASVSVMVANADLEGRYMGALATSNSSIAQIFSAEIGGETARVNAISDLNKSKASGYSAEVGAASAAVSATATANQALATAYQAGISGQTTAINGATETNKGMAGEYSARAGAEGSYVSAQGQRAAAEAQGQEVKVRKALGVAEIAKSMALSNIDAATRKYLGEISLMQGIAQSAAQMVSSALASVSASVSMGHAANSGYNVSEDANAARTNDIHTTKQLIG